MDELLSSVGKALTPVLNGDRGLVFYAITVIAGLTLGSEYLRSRGNAYGKEPVREPARVQEDAANDRIEMN